MITAMKRFISSALILAFCAVTQSVKAEGDNWRTKGDTIVTRHDYKAARYASHWEALIPNHMKLQYAGSIGFLSTGLGWSYGKHQRWETDLLIGFVPRLESNRAKLTFTLRECFLPWEVHLGESRFDFKPLRAMIGLNSIIGHEFWGNEPSRYPSGYYFFSTKFQFVTGFGQEFTFHFREEHQNLLWHSVSFYYDFTTSDRYFLSVVPNKSLGFFDMFYLDLGIKLHIF